MPDGLEIGDPVPHHALPDTAGDMHSVGDPGGGPAAVVVFTCNHCPYALAWHERLMRVATDYAEEGVPLVFVNPNDAERYPRDSYESMQLRVEVDGGWPVPYLRDETQEVAAAWGARTTPDVFVVDSEGRLAYRGAPDADHDDDTQDAAWLRAALEDLMGERAVSQPRTEPVGCSVKWR